MSKGKPNRAAHTSAPSARNPKRPKSTTDPKCSCPCNHIKAPLSLILSASQRTPKIPARQNPREKQRDSQNSFQVPETPSSFNFFKSLRGPVSLHHFSKAAHASARIQSLLTKPAPALMHFPLPEQPQNQGSLWKAGCRRSLNLSPAAHFAEFKPACVLLRELNQSLPGSVWAHVIPALC